MKILIISQDNFWTKKLVDALCRKNKHEYLYCSECSEELINEINPDWVFFFHWSEIIDEKIYKNHRCALVHTSNLPKGRGGSPLQNQIIEGINTTKVNIIEICKPIDSGKIYCSSPITLQGGITDIWLTIADTAKDLIEKVVDGNIIPIPQNGSPEVYKRKKDNRLKFNSEKDILHIYDQIRMLDSEEYPNAYIVIGGFKLEFSRAKLKGETVLSDVRIKNIKINPNKSSISKSNIKQNILISGLGGSLFPTLHNYLKEKYNLFYVDSNSNLDKIYKDYNFFLAPLIESKKYIKFIKNIIKKNKINYYIPLIDEEITGAKKLEGWEGVKVISPTTQFSELCLDKHKLMQCLNNLNISNLPSYLGNDFINQLKYPLFVKPNIGRGSRGIRKINNKDQLKAYFTLEDTPPEETLIQPFIQGKEYTVGINVNPNNEILSICSKRIIEKKGITRIGIIEDNTHITKACKEITEQLKPCGPFNVQLMLDKNNYVHIFEINPRFSTTTIMEYASGLDLISSYIEYSDKEYNSSPIIPKDNLVLYRKWDNTFYYE